MQIEHLTPQPLPYECQWTVFLNVRGEVSMCKAIKDLSGVEHPASPCISLYHLNPSLQSNLFRG